MNYQNCNNCKYALFIDYGYSNYTVEGTDFECAKHVHPDKTFDRFYGQAPELNYGANCPEFEEGETINMDVDGDNFNTLTQEQKIIWAMKHRQ